jgi:hypothetical protein
MDNKVLAFTALVLWLIAQKKITEKEEDGETTPPRTKTAHRAM